MESVRRIVVGVELGPHGGLTETGASALRFARVIASGLSHGHILHLVHVVRDESAKELERLRAAVDELLVGISHRLELVPEAESVAATLLETIASLEPFLVVVGHAEGSKWGRGRLGSVARSLLLESEVPVVVARPPVPTSVSSVLIATDLSGQTDAAVVAGATLAARFGARIHVLHARQTSMEEQLDEGLRGPEEIAEARREAVRKAKAAAEELLLRAGVDEGYQVDVVKDAPEPAIRRAVEALGPDLLVLGTVQRKGLQRWVIGNTAERLLDPLPCSLLVVSTGE